MNRQCRYCDQRSEFAQCKLCEVTLEQMDDVLGCNKMTAETRTLMNDPIRKARVDMYAAAIASNQPIPYIARPM